MRGEAVRARLGVARVGVARVGVARVGVERVLCAADSAKGVRAKFRQSVARSELRVFLNFDLTPFALPASKTQHRAGFMGSDAAPRRPDQGGGAPSDFLIPIGRGTDHWEFHLAPMRSSQTDPSAGPSCSLSRAAGEGWGEGVCSAAAPST